MSIQSESDCYTKIALLNIVKHTICSYLFKFAARFFNFINAVSYDSRPPKSRNLWQAGETYSRSSMISEKSPPHLSFSPKRIRALTNQ